MTMKNHNIGVAVIGTGFMGPVHTEALRRLGIKVTGILGSTLQKSTKAAEELDLPRGYATMAEVMADPEVRSVHITTPNRHHYSMACSAIEAGKHVLCEKPLAMNATESADLVRRAASSGLKCGVNYNMRFYPLCLEARARVRAGQVGRIIGVQGSYVQDWLLRQTDYNWRVLTSEGGALRAVSDIGTHWMDLVCSITGLEVESVFADLKTVHATRKRPIGEVQTFSTSSDTSDIVEVPIETEDLGSILIRFTDGIKGNLWVSQVTAGRKNCLRFELSGSESSVAWNSESPNDLWIGNRDRENLELPKDPGLLQTSARSFADYPGGHAEGYPDSFKMCFRAFYDAVSGRDPVVPYPSFEDGHQEIVFCDAVQLSAKQERWVSLEEMN